MRDATTGVRTAQCAATASERKDKTKQRRPSHPAEQTRISRTPGRQAGRQTGTGMAEAEQAATQTHGHTNGQAVLFLAYHTQTDRNIRT